jgi:outer membrane lipoprotein-sorting protein
MTFEITRRRFLGIVLAGSALLLPPVLPAPAYAKKYGPIELSAEQRQAIQRVNDFINSFKTLRGDFVQTNSRGQSVRGIMMIAKPGKIRFEYEPPVPLLIVSDGKWLTIKNTAKERGDQVPLSATPLRLVVASEIDLLAETDVIGFDRNEGLTSVTLQDKKGKLGGYIVLVYDENAKTLQQWMVVDGKGKRTTVELANLETGVKLDPKLFRVKIDRDKSKR